MKSLKLVKPKVVIFDWDNTLVDTWELIHESVKRVFIEFGKEPLTLEQTKSSVHKSLRDTFPIVFGDKWKEVSKRYYEHYLNIHLDYLKPLPGVVEVLDSLSVQGIDLGIISNKKGDILRQEVKHFSWDRYFKRVIGSFDTSEDKPSPVPVIELLRDVELTDSQQEVWFIGDTMVDMECAKNAKCLPIFFGEGDQAIAVKAGNHHELLKLFASTLNH